MKTYGPLAVKIDRRTFLATGAAAAIAPVLPHVPKPLMVGDPVLELGAGDPLYAYRNAVTETIVPTGSLTDAGAFSVMQEVYVALARLGGMVRVAHIDGYIVGSRVPING